MVGGPDAAFEKVKPLFALMGKNVTLVGGNGDGQTCKVANQIIVALNIEAVGEALLFASKMGADPAKVRQALMGGFASSRILEVHGERMIKRTFDPGFRIELHQKDLNLALSSARSRSGSRCPIPRRRRSFSTPAQRTAARRGTIPRWCGRWSSSATSRSGRKSDANGATGAGSFFLAPAATRAAGPPRPRRHSWRGARASAGPSRGA